MLRLVMCYFKRSVCTDDFNSQTCQKFKNNLGWIFASLFARLKIARLNQGFKFSFPFGPAALKLCLPRAVACLCLVIILSLI